MYLAYAPIICIVIFLFIIAGGIGIGIAGKKPLEKILVLISGYMVGGAIIAGGITYYLGQTGLKLGDRLITLSVVAIGFGIILILHLLLKTGDN